MYLIQEDNQRQRENPEISKTKQTKQKHPKTLTWIGIAMNLSEGKQAIRNLSKIFSVKKWRNKKAPTNLYPETYPFKNEG